MGVNCKNQRPYIDKKYLLANAKKARLTMIKDSCTRLTETQIQQIHYRRMKAIQKNLERYKLRLLAYNHLVAKARKARLTSMRNENSKLTDVQIQQIFKNRLEAICKKRKVLGLLLNTKNNHPQ